MRIMKRPELSPTAEKIARRIERAKGALAREWRGQDPARERMVNLALGEAAALAWDSGVPQLVFPTLAMEKVATVNQWWAKQEQIRRGQLSGSPEETAQQLAE
jgi:hypothetical protein